MNESILLELAKDFRDNYDHDSDAHKYGHEKTQCRVCIATEAIKKWEDSSGKETGMDLIAKERRRQIEKEGWSAEHDKQHRSGELAIAAAKYAIYHTNDTQLLDFNLDNAWPWDDKWWKPSSDPIKNLVKAGALIVAEIDRLTGHESVPPYKEEVDKEIK